MDAIGFIGFEQKEEELIAFIASEKFDEEVFNHLLESLQPSFKITFQKKEIAEQNWNNEWEKNFQPILIGNDIAVRASFHEPFPGVKHEIIIDPKMSFGTGHHATTSMMMQLMLKENFENRSVLDFGSGTGILSILASKLGTASILAIDNDSWAFENAKENLELNHVTNTEAVLGDSADFVGRTFDIILANINREVLLKSMNQFSQVIASNGLLIMSGFLEDDGQKILGASANVGFQIKNEIAESGWKAIAFCKLSNPK